MTQPRKPTQNEIKETIERKTEERKIEKLADKIAQKTGVEFRLQVEKLAQAFGIIADYLKRLEETAKENKPPLPPETQKVSGEVRVENAADFKTELQKVEVVNQPAKVNIGNLPDIDGLRADLLDILRAVNDIVSNETDKNKKALELLKDFLSRLIVKQDAELLQALKPLRFLTSDPMRPLSVRLSDGERFYKAIAGLTQTLAAGAGGVNQADIDEIKDLLTQIEDNTANIEINIENLTIDTGQLEDLAGSTLHVDYGDAIIAPATETVLCTLTAPTGKKLRLKGAFAEGVDDGLFRLYVNNVLFWRARNAWTQRNVETHIELEATAGQIIKLTAENLRNTNKDFSGIIYAYEL